MRKTNPTPINSKICWIGPLKKLIFRIARSTGSKSSEMSSPSSCRHTLFGFERIGWSQCYIFGDFGKFFGDFGKIFGDFGKLSAFFDNFWREMAFSCKPIL
jgi:hypothetical protein